MTDIKKLFGLTPLLIDADRKIEIQQGVCAASSSAGNPAMDIVIPVDSVLDPMTVGPWGLDRARTTGWWQLWALGKIDGSLPSTCMLAPQGQTVNFAAFGYNAIRILPYAAYLTGNYVRTQIVTTWGSTAIIDYYLQSEADNGFTMPSTNGAWATVSLRNAGGKDLVPSMCRFAWLSIESVPISGAGGLVQVRTPNAGDGGPTVYSNQGPAIRGISLDQYCAIEYRSATAAQFRGRVLQYQIMSTY